MDIIANEGILFYLSCIICSELIELEKIIKEDVYLTHFILYNPRFQYLMVMRDRLIENLHTPEIQKQTL